MKQKKMPPAFRRSGYTLIEILTASTIGVFVLGVMLMAFLMAGNMYQNGTKRALIQREAQLAVEKITKGLAAASTVTVSGGGDRIDFVYDPAQTPLVSSDDVAGAYYLTGTARKTPENESIYDLFYDPDTATGGNERVLSRHLVKKTAVSLFQESGRSVLINFSLKDDNARDGLQTVDVSTRVYGRNR